MVFYILANSIKAMLNKKENDRKLYKKCKEKKKRNIQKNGKVKNVIFYVLYCTRFYSVAMV